MLLSLAQWLQTLSPEFGFFRVFQYLTFRAVMAAVTALLIGLAAGPYVIVRLRELKIGQPIRGYGMETHLSKSGTPTLVTRWASVKSMSSSGRGFRIVLNLYIVKMTSSRPGRFCRNRIGDPSVARIAIAAAAIIGAEIMSSREPPRASTSRLLAAIALSVSVSSWVLTGATLPLSQERGTPG